MFEVSLFIKKAKLSIILLVLISPCVALAQGLDGIKTIEVIGREIICQNDVPSAKKQAIANALASAVERIVAKVLTEDLRIKNFETLNLLIYNNTDIFIKSYKLLAEISLQKFYIVMVSVNIITDKIYEQLADAGILRGNKIMPQVVVSISLENKDYLYGKEAEYIKNFAQISAEKSLKNKGFIIKTENNMDVDIVIHGKALAKPSFNIMAGSIRSYEAEVSLWAIKAETGKVIAKTTKNAVATSSNEKEGANAAISKASKSAGNDIALRIVEKLQKKDKKLSKIKIIVEASNLAHFVEFRKTLHNLSEVNEIQLAEIKNDKRVMIIDFKGDREDLAKSLMLKTFDLFGLNISAIEDNILKIELTTK